MAVTKIIAGFPGVGKSHFFQRSASAGNHLLDSDSSKFSWMMTPEGRVRHPEWPNNYIEHIKANIGKAPLIMVSTHKEVRDALIANELPFTLVYPSLQIKDEYIQRYVARGDNDAFVKLLEQHYDAWISELMAQKGCAHVALRSGQYLSDVIDRL